MIEKTSKFSATPTTTKHNSFKHSRSNDIIQSIKKAANTSMT